MSRHTNIARTSLIQVLRMESFGNLLAASTPKLRIYLKHDFFQMGFKKICQTIDVPTPTIPLPASTKELLGTNDTRHVLHVLKWNGASLSLLKTICTKKNTGAGKEVGVLAVWKLSLSEWWNSNRMHLLKKIEPLLTTGYCNLSCFEEIYIYISREHQAQVTKSFRNLSDAWRFQRVELLTAWHIGLNSPLICISFMQEEVSFCGWNPHDWLPVASLSKSSKMPMMSSTLSEGLSFAVILLGRTQKRYLDQGSTSRLDPPDTTT